MRVGRIRVGKATSKVRRLFFFVSLLLSFLGLWSRVLAVEGVIGRDLQEVKDTAQLSSKVVAVSRIYTPTVGDAEKISVLPSLAEPQEYTVPPMHYSFLQRPVQIDFPMRPIPPARVGQEALLPLPHWYVKAGFGNYWSPVLDASYSSDRSESITYDVSLKHQSAWGKVRLFDGEKVKAPYSRSSLAGNARGVVGSVALEGKVGYQHAYDVFYGADTLRSAVYNALWQSETNSHMVDAEFDVESLHLDSARFYYAARVRYGGYYDSRGKNQSRFTALARGHKFWRHNCFGGEVQFDYLNKAMHPAIGDNLVVSAMPWVRIFGERWRVQVGVQFTYDYNVDKGMPYFFPKAHLSYDVVEGYFVPYVEVLSGLEMADYRTIREENPWITPGLRVRNAAKRLDIVAGVKGKFSKRFSYNFRGSYAIYDSAHFFVNRVADIKDSTGNVVGRALQSDYGVVYDNADVLHVNGVLDYRIGQYLSVGVQGDYWHWSARHVGEAWHRPQFMATARAAYSLQRKLYVGLEFYLLGGRKARGALGENISLPILYDLNLHARYRFVSGWSVFADLRNLIACRHDLYYRYPAQRFNGHLGIIFEF